MYNFLDVFFLIFHSALILFNLFGWIYRKTRRLNLIILVLTGLSWFVLGIFYGMGYCPLTDWHWQVLDHLGKTSPYSSYVQYLLERILGIHISSLRADTITMVCYFTALLLSVYTNFFHRHLHLWHKGNTRKPDN